jgi:hypothetical protein
LDFKTDKYSKFNFFSIEKAISSLDPTKQHQNDVDENQRHKFLIFFGSSKDLC